MVVLGLRLKNAGFDLDLSPLQCCRVGIIVPDITEGIVKMLSPS